MITKPPTGGFFIAITMGWLIVMALADKSKIHPVGDKTQPRLHGAF